MEAGGMGERRGLTAVGAKATHRCQNPPEAQTWRFAAQIRKRAAPPAHPPRVGPQTLANPQPTGVGEGGPGGRSPHGKGFGGCAPTNSKGGEQPTPGNPATSGTQNPGKPSANGGGQNGGSRGAWGVSPTKPKRGEQPTPATPPRVGPQTLANPQPTRAGKPCNSRTHSLSLLV